MASSVSPPQNLFAAMATAGVSWFFPPKGMYTLREPMVESNISDRPFFEHTFSPERDASRSLANDFFFFVEIAHAALFDLGTDDLLDAVGIQKVSGNIDDLPALEQHLHTAVVRHDGDGRSCQVLFRGQADKGVLIFGRDDDGHALLRFGNGQLRARKPFIFEGDAVEVDDKPVGEFADGDGDAARAEVVALFDHAGGFAVQEQALQFALCERVALLHLGAARLHRVAVMRLGRTEVAPPQPSRPVSPPKRMMMSPFLRLFAVDHVALGAADHEARLQPLRLIAGVIHLVYDARRQADLVAVGRKARRSRLGESSAGAACRGAYLRSFHAGRRCP